MNKILLVIGISLMIFLVGCGPLASLAISIGGELICNIFEDPTLTELCSTATGFFFDINAGTIEVHSVNGQWITLTREPMRLDLLQSPGTQQIMVLKNVPPGRYDKVRIDLAGIQIKTDKKTYIASLPNKELIIDTTIVVENGKKSGLELNLDIAKSLHITEQKQLIFTPVIDVKSKKNILAEVTNTNDKRTARTSDMQTVIGTNKETVLVKSSTLVESKRVGMDLNGKMKKDFVLDKNIKLTLKDNKITLKEPSTNENRINTATSPASRTSASISQITEINTENGIPNNRENTNQHIYDQEFTIQAKRWLFSPNRVESNERDSVKLRIVPDNGLTFTFSIPSLGIEQQVSGPTEIYLNDLQSGTYSFECSSCDDWRGMRGTLVVESLRLNNNEQAPNGEVSLTIESVDIEWYGNYGKITDIDYTIRNGGDFPIGAGYLLMRVEGYGDAEKKIDFNLLPLTVPARNTRGSRLHIPSGFTYNSVTAGDLKNVEISFDLYDTAGNKITSFRKEFDIDIADANEQAEMEQQSDYSGVRLILNDVKIDWRDTWGKITNIDYTIQNEGTTTITPSYLLMTLEGYDDFEKRIPFITSWLYSPEVSPNGMQRHLADPVPQGFSYNSVASGDLSNVEIHLKLLDSSDREMASFEGEFDLRGS